ncbi:MAG: patatin-like phospholipase family protein, partial [Gemmataceae bacterium]
MVCAWHWRRAAVLAVALLTLVSACSQRSRTCLPPEFTTSARYHDLNATPSANRAVDADLEEEILARFRGQGNGTSAKPTGKCYRILALSGGGANGAYTVGVLNGWSATGTRPTFDVVTGISTGGLIATYAFLGQAYDGALRDMYTSVTSDDIYQKRPRVAILWSESVATAGPLKRLIDEQIHCDILRQVAAAHAQGRRLYIGTTNLDTRRLVVWDMGAIASSGRPESLELYRT